MEKAKYGKMRQVKAVNGSQMVVKIGAGYYRRLKGKTGDKLGFTAFFDSPVVQSLSFFMAWMI